MAALKPDLDQIPERGGHVVERREQDSRHGNADHVHAPRDELSETELFCHGATGAAEIGKLLPDEHRREDDVDEKTGNRLPARMPFLRHVRAEPRQEGKPNRAADDGRRQIEFAQERHGGAHGLPDHEQQAQRAERDDGGHDAKIFP